MHCHSFKNVFKPIQRGGRLCSLIKEADPESKAKVLHDIRKYEASLALQQDMLLENLTEDFNWSSPLNFYGYYFKTKLNKFGQTGKKLSNVVKCL